MTVPTLIHPPFEGGSRMLWKQLASSNVALQEDCEGWSVVRRKELISSKVGRRTFGRPCWAIGI